MGSNIDAAAGGLGFDRQRHLPPGPVNTTRLLQSRLFAAGILVLTGPKARGDNGQGKFLTQINFEILYFLMSVKQHAPKAICARPEQEGARVLSGRALKPENHTRAGNAAGVGKFTSAWEGDFAMRGKARSLGNHSTA